MNISSLSDSQMPARPVNKFCLREFGEGLPMTDLRGRPVRACLSLTTLSGAQLRWREGRHVEVFDRTERTVNILSLSDSQMPARPVNNFCLREFGEGLPMTDLRGRPVRVCLSLTTLSGRSCGGVRVPF